jgi:hypothetical protein
MPGRNPMVSQKPTALPTWAITNSGKFHQASTMVDETLCTLRVIALLKWPTQECEFVIDVHVQTRPTSIARKQGQQCDLTSIVTSSI